MSLKKCLMEEFIKSCALVRSFLILSRVIIDKKKENERRFDIVATGRPMVQ